MVKALFPQVGWSNLGPLLGFVSYNWLKMCLGGVAQHLDIVGYRGSTFSATLSLYDLMACKRVCWGYPPEVLRVPLLGSYPWQCVCSVALGLVCASPLAGWPYMLCLYPKASPPPAGSYKYWLMTVRVLMEELLPRKPYSFQNFVSECGNLKNSDMTLIGGSLNSCINEECNWLQELMWGWL